jgi:hypothetical protein
MVQEGYTDNLVHASPITRSWSQTRCTRAMPLGMGNTHNFDDEALSIPGQIYQNNLDIAMRVRRIDVNDPNLRKLVNTNIDSYPNTH